MHLIPPNCTLKNGGDKFHVMCILPLKINWKKKLPYVNFPQSCLFPWELLCLVSSTQNQEGIYSWSMISDNWPLAKIWRHQVTQPPPLWNTAFLRRCSESETVPLSGQALASFLFSHCNVNTYVYLS